MSDMQKMLTEDNYNKYISDLAGGDREQEELQAEQRKQLLQEMRDKDEKLRRQREKFEAAAQSPSPKKKKRVVEATTPQDPNAPKLPKVTKKELNLLKSLTEEEKEAFKKQVEDDEAMLEGLNRRISDKTANFDPSGSYTIKKGDLTELKSFNAPPQ